VISAASACATVGTHAAKKEDPRKAVMERSRVWSPTKVAAMEGHWEGGAAQPQIGFFLRV
jgi:hypothetical protein